MDATAPVELIYIAGTGRSGSTLLELLLHAHPQMVSCGELQIWPREISIAPENPCGCRLPVVECPFWSALRARVDPLAQPEPRIHHFRKGWRGRQVYRSELVSRLHRSGGAGSASSDCERTYADNNARVLRAFADLWAEQYGTRPRWLVDASKDPYRLWWLLRSPLFRVRTIHLVRDPRGYVRSAVGIGRRRLSRIERLRGIAVQAAVWTVTNHLVQQVLQGNAAPSEFCTVSYEQLARDPEAVLRQVCSTIGCAFEPSVLTRFREGPFHTISGNRMRFEQRGIELDESWREVLTSGEQALVGALSRVPPRTLIALLDARARLRGPRGS